MPGPFDSVHDEPSPFQDPPSRRLPPGSVIERGRPRHPPEEAETAEGEEPSGSEPQAKPATRTRRKAQPQG